MISKDLVCLNIGDRAGSLHIKSTNMLKIGCTVFTDFAKIDYVDRY